MFGSSVQKLEKKARGLWFFGGWHPTVEVAPPNEFEVADLHQENQLTTKNTKGTKKNDHDRISRAAPTKT